MFKYREGSSIYDNKAALLTTEDSKQLLWQINQELYHIG